MSQAKTPIRTANGIATPGISSEKSKTLCATSAAVPASAPMTGREISFFVAAESHAHANRTIDADAEEYAEVRRELQELVLDVRERGERPAPTCRPGTRSRTRHARCPVSGWAAMIWSAEGQRPSFTSVVDASEIVRSSATTRSSARYAAIASAAETATGRIADDREDTARNTARGPARNTSRHGGPRRRRVGRAPPAGAHVQRDEDSRPHEERRDPGS